MGLSYSKKPEYKPIFFRVRITPDYSIFHNLIIETNSVPTPYCHYQPNTLFVIKDEKGFFGFSGTIIFTKLIHLHNYITRANEYRNLELEEESKIEDYVSCYLVDVRKKEDTEILLNCTDHVIGNLNHFAINTQSNILTELLNISVETNNTKDTIIIDIPQLRESNTYKI